MRFEQSIHLSATREAVWPLVAHTDRLNREIGLPPIEFSFSPREAGGTEATACIRVAGQTFRYREHPFDWVFPAFYHVRRTFGKGPFKEIIGGTELHAENGGTRAVVWAEIEPANALSGLICRAVGTKMVADVISACKRFEAYLTERAETPYPRHSALPPANIERLTHALTRLQAAGVDGAIAQRLISYIASAPPEDLLAIRAFSLADRWGLERMTVLKSCLLAAQTGLLDLRWRVLCPFCRGGQPGAAHLSELAAAVHCETCNIRYDAAFDRSVEVCFSVATAIRRIPETVYCVGGPGLSPHAVAQWVLLPGESRKMEIAFQPGDYTLLSLQCNDPMPLKIEENGKKALCLRMEKTGKRASLILEGAPSAINCKAVWTLQNDTKETIVLRLETPEWTNQAVTAATVTSLQAFRDQFGSEVLSPGTELAVRQICILFSDLKGSTAMYRERGDALSYQAVRDHFAMMRRNVTAHNGAIVKTIGDAVMATFMDPAEGLATAIAIQREAQSPEHCLMVKLGLHFGPAIAVNANELLDYFGQTVNLAARLQRESEGGDIVLDASIANDPHVAAILKNSVILLDRFETEVRGLEGPFQLLRIRVPNSGANCPRP
jgi:adenylate cyclase